MLATISKAALLAASVGLAVADTSQQTSAAAVATKVATELHPEAAKAEHAHWLNTITTKKAGALEFLEKPHRHAAPSHKVHAAATKSGSKTVRATATAPKPVKVAAPNSADDVLDADDDSLDAPPAAPAKVAAAAAPRSADSADDSDQDSVVTQLSSETSEVKESRANIDELESALKADIALLRESAKMQRVAKSHKRRTAAEKQVKRSEQLVKVTSAMVKESRAAAVSGAQRALRQTSAVRAAADELAAEATAELKALGQPAQASADAASTASTAAAADDDSSDEEEASM